jgi:integrase
MKDLAERYIREHVRIRMKPPNDRHTERVWERLILPRFGPRKVADIDRADIAEFHADLASTPVMANRVKSMLSTAFSLAELWRWRAEGTNPCRHVRPFKERSRERYLTEQELRRLGAVLDEAEESWGVSAYGIAAIRLLILTGCRSAEIVKLRWEWVDFEARCLRLPDSKTGAKTVKLNAPALEILANLERLEGNPYVIPGKKRGSHRGPLGSLWDRIREAAELKDVHIHDLRHTFASYGVSAGFTLPMIGKLLGHTKTATTERYAHLADDPVVAANEQIGATLKSTLAGKPKAAVVSIGGRNRT